MGSAFTEKREKNEKEESVLYVKALRLHWLSAAWGNGWAATLFLRSAFLLLALTIQALA